LLPASTLIKLQVPLWARHDGPKIKKGFMQPPPMRICVQIAHKNACENVCCPGISRSHMMDDRMMAMGSGVLCSPVVALLTGEALQVVDIGAGAHHHLEGRDHFAAGGAVARIAKQSAEEEC